MDISISVVIPMYNRRQTILDSINSVLHQTEIDKIVEIIVVDDGSTDDSVSIITNFIDEQKYGPKIRIVRGQHNGVSSARNIGATVAEGNWVAFLDSDDEWKNDKVSHFIKVLSIHKDAALIGDSLRKSNIEKKESKKLFIHFEPLIQTSIVLKSAFISVNGFDEKLSHAEDLDFTVRVSSQFNVYTTGEDDIVLGHGKARFGESGLSQNLNAMEKGIEDTLKKSLNSNILSKNQYVGLLILQKIKHMRRITITYFKNLQYKE